MTSVARLAPPALPDLAELHRASIPDAAWGHVAHLAREAGVALGDPTRQSLAEARAANLAYNGLWNVVLPAVAEARDHEIPGPVGPLALRIIRPPGAGTGRLPALLYLHGGGFVFNSLRTHERIMRVLGARTGAVVVGVGYSLAPEHRYPTQLNELAAAFKWLLGEAAALGIDGKRIGVAGDSAGATLALSLMLRLRDDGRADALKVGLLFYGMYGTDLETASHRLFGGGPGLTSAKVGWFWNAYLRLARLDGDAAAVPALADVRGLAPAVLIAGGRDCLRDDTLRLAASFAAANVPHTVRVAHGMPHSFLIPSAFVPAADEVLTSAASAVARFL